MQAVTAVPELSLRQIDEHRARWRNKPSLRMVYNDYLNRMGQSLVEGPVLEIGGGSGNLKESIPDCISLDVQWTPWLDIVADAHRLPFSKSSFSNIVMLDVFHHLRFPVRFLNEAMRVLRAGGRLIMIEPNISPVSWCFLKLFHEEPIRLRDDPFDPEPRSGPSPYESNQAIPYVMFIREPDRLESHVPDLKIVSTARFSLWAYPLSGGFQPWSLLPLVMTGPLLRIERPISNWIGWLAGFRLMIVAEKMHEPEM